MDNITKGIIAVVVLGAITFLGMTYPKSSGEYFGASATSTSGTFFTNAKWASIVWAPIGTATSTSILNTDSTDRIVTDATYHCSGVTTVNTSQANWVLTAATTSTSGAGLGTNTNYVLSTTVATSTAELFIASTTPGLSSSAFVRRWATNSYLTFALNASSTAQCTIGAHYIND